MVFKLNKYYKIDQIPSPVVVRSLLTLVTLAYVVPFCEGIDLNPLMYGIQSLKLDILTISYSVTNPKS